MKIGFESNEILQNQAIDATLSQFWLSEKFDIEFGKMRCLWKSISECEYKVHILVCLIK